MGNWFESPADINPHLGLVSRMSPRSGRHCSLRPSWCSWLCATVPSPRSTRPFSRTRNWPLRRRLCHQGCAGHGSFDRSPLSVPSREVHERSTAGTSQVSKRSAETGAAPASRKQVYSWPVVAFCSHPQTRQARPAGPRGQSKAVPNISSVLTTAADPNGPCLGQTLDLPVIFPEPDGLLTEDGGPAKSRSKRFGETPASASPPRTIRPKCATEPGS